MGHIAFYRHCAPLERKSGYAKLPLLKMYYPFCYPKVLGGYWTPFNSNYADAYYNRGVARLHLQAWEEAESDLTTAKKMELDIIAAFRNNYENVADFEGRYGIQLPPAIAAMLTPQ